MRRVFAYLVEVTTMLMLSTGIAGAAEFRGLGDFEGGYTNSRASALSADGKSVVGTAWSEIGGEPFIWDKQQGMQRLDNILTVITPGAAHDISADGSVVVGRADFGNVSAFRWQDAGFQMFGNASPSVANGVSADGNMLVGTDNYSPGGGPAPVTGTAFRWTAADGIVTLADLPGGPDCARANDVSANGRIVVGKGDCDASFQVEDLGTAVRWVDGGAAESLGSLDGGFWSSSYATAASPDGGSIVGYSSSKLGGEPFLWREGTGMTGLGQLPGASYGEALDASNDGRFVVGSSGDRAFLWTQHLGMRDLTDMLERRPGLGVEGWTLTAATAISPDGLYIVGEGINPEGEIEGWWVELFRFPEDDDDGDLDLDDLNGVRNNFGAVGGDGLDGDMPPQDGIVDLNDLNYVRNHFAILPQGGLGVPEPNGLALALLAIITLCAAKLGASKSNSRFV